MPGTSNTYSSIKVTEPSTLALSAVSERQGVMFTLQSGMLFDKPKVIKVAEVPGKSCISPQRYTTYSMRSIGTAERNRLGPVRSAASGGLPVAYGRRFIAVPIGG